MDNLWLNMMKPAFKETDDSRAFRDDRHDRGSHGKERVSLPEGGSSLDGNADGILRIWHGIQAHQDQDHCGHDFD